jgi:hypothetical protein
LKIRGNPAWPDVVFFGASLGLAMLTKALAYLYAPAFCVWVTLSLCRNGFRFALPRLALVAAIALGLNGGYFLRNWSSTGTLIGMDRDSGPGVSYQNEIHTPGAVVSNILRNLSLEVPQCHEVSATTQALVIKLHALLGLDPSDARLTAYASAYYVPATVDETTCASPAHLTAILFSLGGLIVFRRRLTRAAAGLALSLLAGALLFCLVLKWQPYHSRLHLPLFLLAAPLVAVVFEAMKSRMVVMIFIGLFLAGAFSPLFFSATHPLLGRGNIFTTPAPAQRFVFGPDDLPDYEGTLRLLREKGVKCVGVIGPENNSGWEYPLFDPDNMNYGFPWRVEQVRVRNCYSGLETKARPDAVVYLWPTDEEFLAIHGQRYHRVLRGRVLSTYVPQLF